MTSWVCRQRLIRQAGGIRTLYLPGMEVSVTGTTRTINCYLTIGATQVGTKTVTTGATSLMWACGNMQNSNVCQVTAGSGAIPSRKRYAPYGASRQTTPVTFANTDRGFLDQPHDTNGLVYLNNRYHDPILKFAWLETLTISRFREQLKVPQVSA